MKRTLKCTLSLFLVCFLLLGSFSAGSTASAEEETAYQTGDVIEFGSYPQTRVTDEETLAALDAIELTWQSYGYYERQEITDLNDPAYDPAYTMIRKDYMQYADVTIGGAKYRGVRFFKYRPDYSTGVAAASFGSIQPRIYQNGYVCETVYWFSWDPIRWHILDAQTGLLLAESVIDAQAFNPVFFKDTDNGIWYRDKTCSAYASEYAQSFIRSWLTDPAVENGFANEAFTDRQWSRIRSTALDNSAVAQSDKPYAGADTSDRIFLLSTSELNGEVQFTSWIDWSKWNYPSRTVLADGTDYARCQGAICVPNGSGAACEWMTRTISQATSSAGANCAVYLNSCQFSGKQVHGTSGIRPAMRVDLSQWTESDDKPLSGTCGETIQWTFDEESGVLSLSGTGTMDSLGAFADYGYSAWREEIFFVVAADGVTSVGAHAFEGCPLLQEIILGADVTSVGEGAFLDCPILRNVTFLSTEIALDGAFPEDCSGWTYVYARGCSQGYRWAKRSGAEHNSFSVTGDTLKFNGTINVHDAYAYTYLPMLIRRFDKVKKIDFNCLRFLNIPANHVPAGFSSSDDGCLEMRHVEVTLLYVSPDGESEEITYARMTELIESGDFRAFKLRISSEDGSLVREETIEQKLEAVFPFIPARILRAVSKAINFIIRIFTKK